MTDLMRSNVSLGGGVAQLDLSLTNHSISRYVPLVECRVVAISSASGTVRAINTDNNRGGMSAADAALYDLSHHQGDEVFASGEASAALTLCFRDDASKLFTFSAVRRGQMIRPDPLYRLFT